MATYSFIDNGLEGSCVTVECNISRGLPAINIVGMANKAVDESKERLRASIIKSGYNFPKGRIVLNLAPADIPKDTASLDLAMAIATLSADGQINYDISKLSLIGELSLDGQLRPVRGIIGKIISALNETNTTIIIPYANIKQANLINDSRLLSFRTPKQLVETVNSANLTNYKNSQLKKPLVSKPKPSNIVMLNFGEIIGQETAKRALLIAPRGGHNILLSGPPGTGKSMLTKAFVGVLTELNSTETLESTHIFSLTFSKPDKVISQIPLRSPHHSASDVSILGGGHTLRPGEISLAHSGVLFLDEFPEFSRVTIESLRQPLEDRNITIARAQKTATFPAKFILLATSNSCPCGYYNSTKACNCSAADIQRYQKKLSGPIMDRIDIFVNVNEVEHESLLKENKNKVSAKYKSIVESSRLTQNNRQGLQLNCHLTDKKLKSVVSLEPNAEQLLVTAAKKMDLSARGYMRTIRVARTIADLEKSKNIKKTCSRSSSV